MSYWQRNDPFISTGHRSFGNKRWISAAAVADFGDSQALIPPSPWPDDVRYGMGIEIGGGQFWNNSGNLGVFGLALRYRTSSWSAGVLSAAGAYTDDTADAQNATTNDFVMHTGGSSGSGAMFSCDERFNILDLIYSTAGDQTAPVSVIEYWDGSAWTPHTTAASATILDNLNTGTGEKLIAFPTPHNWVKGGSGTNVPQHRYNLRVLQTNGGAGSANPLVRQVFLGQIVIVNTQLADNSTFGILRQETGLRISGLGEALFPFTDQPHIANAAQVDYRYYNA